MKFFLIGFSVSPFNLFSRGVAAGPALPQKCPECRIFHPKAMVKNKVDSQVIPQSLGKHSGDNGVCQPDWYHGHVTVEMGTLPTNCDSAVLAYY